MTEDEIRRMRKEGILIIGDNKPMKIKLPTIAEIAPWRKQIGINPFHGKPFLRRVKLRISRRDGSRIGRLSQQVWRFFTKEAKQ